MKFGVILGVALAGFAAPVVAQSLAPSATAINPVPQNDDTTRILVDVTRVNMLFTVTDKKGRFITDLSKEDFEIIESKKLQPIQEFTAESDLPLRLAILVDTSNSIRDRFKFEQEAAVEFINSVVHSGIDKAMVVSFDSSAELVADLIDDTRQLNGAITSLRPSRFFLMGSSRPSGRGNPMKWNMLAMCCRKSESKMASLSLEKSFPNHHIQSLPSATSSSS